MEVGNKNSHILPIPERLFPLWSAAAQATKKQQKDPSDSDSSPNQSSQAATRFTHPELFLQASAPSWVGRQNAVDITVKLPDRHLCLFAQDGLHQSIMDENVLLLKEKTQTQED